MGKYEFDEVYTEFVGKMKELEEIKEKMKDLHLSTNVSQSNCNQFVEEVEKSLKEASKWALLLRRHIDDDGMDP